MLMIRNHLSVINTSKNVLLNPILENPKSLYTFHKLSNGMSASHLLASNLCKSHHLSFIHYSCECNK